MKIIEAGKRYGFDKVFDYVAKDPQKRGEIGRAHV